MLDYVIYFLVFFFSSMYEQTKSFSNFEKQGENVSFLVRKPFLDLKKKKTLFASE
jgi:ABC-type polysaccharide transport system permease subunit